METGVLSLGRVVQVPLGGGADLAEDFVGVLAEEGGAASGLPLELFGDPGGAGVPEALAELGGRPSRWTSNRSLISPPTH